MYNNIGAKLKFFAICIFVCGSIAAIICAIALGEDIFLLLGIGTGGILVSWVSSWALYGLGYIAEKVDTIEYQIKKINKQGDQETKDNPISALYNYKFTKNTSENSNNMSVKKVCPHCGERVKSSKCEMCGKENNLFG